MGLQLGIAVRVARALRRALGDRELGRVAEGRARRGEDELAHLGRGRGRSRVRVRGRGRGRDRDRVRVRGRGRGRGRDGRALARCIARRMATVETVMFW